MAIRAGIILTFKIDHRLVSAVQISSPIVLRNTENDHYLFTQRLMTPLFPVTIDTLGVTFSAEVIGEFYETKIISCMLLVKQKSGPVSS